MAEDIARLGLRVDSQGVKEGADGLDRLTVSAQNAEAAAGGAESAADALANATRNVSGASGEAAAAARRASEEYRRTAAAARQSAVAPGLVLDPLTLTYRKAADEQDKFNKTLTAGGLSAKQYAASLRLLPAQITDIVTGLVSGQPAYLVAIQQGGQLRDSFGGFGETLKALGTIITPTRLLIGGAAASVVLLTKAFLDGQREGFEFNKALILSGNAAGTTAERLAESAKNIDAVVGTQRNAAAVLAQLAGSGRVAADQLEGAALAAIKLEKSAGIAASETVKNFVALGKAPAEGLLKLNEQFRFLTASTYAQVRALQEQGRISEAAALAQETFLKSANSMADSVEQKLGLLQIAARGTGKFFAEMWDELLAVGREKTPQEMLEDIERRLKGGSFGGFAVDGGGGLDLGPGAAEIAALENRRRQLQATINPDDFASRRARAEANRREALLRDEQVLQDEAIKARERSQREAEQRRRAEASAAVAAIKRTLSIETEAYAQQLDLLEARRGANLISETEYYAERRRLVDANADAQRRALEGENARLAQESARVQQAAQQARAAADNLKGLGSPELGRALEEAARREADAQQIQLQNAERIKDNKAAIIALDERRSAQLQVLGVQEGAYWANLAKATEEARSSLERYLALQERQRQRELAGQGAGNLQREFDSGRSAIEDRFEQQRQELERDRRNNPQVDPSIFREREQMLNVALATELAAYERHWEALRNGERNWLNGASEAVRNYIDSVANTAKRTETFIVSAMKGAEDAWVKFVQTGKLSFRELINSVIADLARLSAQRAFASILGAIPFGGAGAGPVPVPSAVIPFAKGGVVSQPTVFGFSKGVGMMAEEATEAIMPLRRTRNGQLGVVAMGGGAPNVTIHNYVGAKVETGWSRGELQVFIREEARRQVASEAPKVIEGQLENPNSRVSKAMSRNTTAARQRN